MKNNKEQSQNVGLSLLKSVGDKGLEVFADAAEIALDSTLDEGVLKSVPVFGWLVKGHIMISNIRDRIFLKKIAMFLWAASNISEEERSKFQQKIGNDENFQRKVGENLILLLDRHDHFEKSFILGKLFAHFAKDAISYDLFQRLSSVVDRAYIGDLKSLRDYYLKFSSLDEQTLQSLYSSGLIGLKIVGPGMTGSGNDPNVKYAPNDIGRTFIRLIFENSD